MSVYLVTYDLKKPGQDYSDVLKTIKSYSWARLSESSYAIKTTETADSIEQKIRQNTDSNDNVYVIALHLPWAGYGPQDVNKWLNDNLTGC